MGRWRGRKRGVPGVSVWSCSCGGGEGEGKGRIISPLRGKGGYFRGINILFVEPNL